MTAHSISELRRIQVLLNTLLGEHYVRQSLLSEVCELLGAAGQRQADAYRAAVELLGVLDKDTSRDAFDTGIRGIRSAVERSSAEGGDAHTVVA
jgi:hypothetical protein